MSTVDVGFNTKTRQYSRHLITYLLGDDASGNYVQDRSGYGNDFSPLFCPAWRANSSVFVDLCYTPDGTSTGLFYLCISSGVTGAVAPSWTSVAGVTSSTGGAGTGLFVSQALPNLWGGSAQWINWVGGAAAQTACRPRTIAQMFDFCNPTTKDNTNWTSASNTISASSTNNNVTDTASALPLFTAGDWVKLGFTSAADTSNNGYALVSSSSSGTLAFTTPTGINAAETNKVLNIKKVLEPASFVFAADVSTTATTNGANLMQFMGVSMKTGGSATGHKVVLTVGRAVSYSVTDFTGAAASATNSSGTLSSGGTAKFVAVVVNRALGTVEFYLGTQGGSDATRDSSANLTKRQQCQMMTRVDDVMLFDIARRDKNTDGHTQMRNVQIYCGRSLPAGLTGSGSPALITKIQGGSPLTPSDWA